MDGRSIGLRNERHLETTATQLSGALGALLHVQRHGCSRLNTATKLDLLSARVVDNPLKSPDSSTGKLNVLQA